LKFESEDLPWEAVRVLLAERFSVLPSEIDAIPLPDLLDILNVLDAEAKASKR